MKLELPLFINEYSRRKAAKNFYDFCTWMDPVFFTQAKKHLKEAADALQKVSEGKINKLAISMPPRAGKSYMISLWCAWMIGKHPDGSMMRNSYAADLAEKFSYDVRDIIQKPKFLEVFPGIELKSDRRGLTDWSVTKARESTYFCAGVGGGITGKGCNLAAILDDPVKNIEEAMSEAILDSIWKWYTSTHLSRLETGCPEIHIATRWSKNDPIGRLTSPDSQFYSKGWVTIVIPALDEKGQSFCDEIHTTEEYLDIKKVTESFIWEAEFMQNPIESKGLLFPEGELNKFSISELKSKTPEGIIGYVDTADQGTDYLCTVIGKRFGDYTYITDVLFTQDGVEVTEPLTAQLAIDTRCDVMTVEANAGGKSFADNIYKLLKGRSHCHVEHKQTTANKETRILMSAGYVKEYFYFRKDYQPGSDYDRFMRQFTSYVKMGRNKHDDAADAVTGLAEYMKDNFYINKSWSRPLPEGYYEAEELKDMGYNSYQIKQYMKKRPRPFDIRRDD